MKIQKKDKRSDIFWNGCKHLFVKRVASPAKKYRRFLAQSQWWSSDDLVNYQEEKLRRVVNLAYQHVPYYRGAMQVFNVKPHDIRSLQDLCLLPFVEKETIRKAADEFLSRRRLSPIVHKCFTSGTTGTPLKLYRDLRNIGFEYALLSRQRQWAGLKGGDRLATLKGELLPERVVRQHHYWKMNLAENKLVMSSYHLSEKTIARYFEAFEKYGPAAIDGYPSSISTLALLMLERGLVFPLKAVLTSSETLAPKQKRIIEEAFACTVYDYYGMAERIAAIHTCELGRYHIVPEYSIVELVRNACLEKGFFEIVGTSLNNDAMPLLRYRIGDIVEASAETCPCGRAYPVIKSIVGRIDDSIITPGGKIVGRLDHIFKGANHLVLAQIYQPEQDRIVLRIVPDLSFSKRDGDFILEKLYHRVGEGIRFEIEEVPCLTRTANGKIKSVISEVEKC